MGSGFRDLDSQLSCSGVRLVSGNVGCTSNKQALAPHALPSDASGWYRHVLGRLSLRPVAQKGFPNIDAGSRFKRLLDEEGSRHVSIAVVRQAQLEVRGTHIYDQCICFLTM